MTGFGSGRVDDLAFDEDRRVAEGLARRIKYDRYMAWRQIIEGVSLQTTACHRVESITAAEKSATDLG